MAEIKVQHDTKVIISLSEQEAGKLKRVLCDRVDFEKEEWAEEIYEALDEQNVRAEEYEPL